MNKLKFLRNGLPLSARIYCVFQYDMEDCRHVTPLTSCTLGMISCRTNTWIFSHMTCKISSPKTTITRRKPCLKILLLYRAFSRLVCFLLSIIILSSNFLLYYEHEMQRNLFEKAIDCCIYRLCEYVFPFLFTFPFTFSY